ncbi:MAG: hypothetical protein M1839_000468 [Geoglossum umbratile]|nr:MAG: hypothetical protein M1839_000468 [Geoglossum umbratile]
MTTPNTKGLLKATTSLFQSDKYSDLTINCGYAKYKAHRSVVCPRSTFFDAACNSGFKEGKTGEITLSDDDPATVWRMISFLYTCDYLDTENEVYVDDEIASSNTNSPHAIDGEIAPTMSTTFQPRERVAPFSNVHVYAIAEKYDIPDLKSHSMKKFRNWVKNGWSNGDFPAIIKEVFTSTPNSDRGLRDIVSWAFKEHCLELLEKGDGFIDEIKDLGEFWLSVLKLAAHDPKLANRGTRKVRGKKRTKVLVETAPAERAPGERGPVRTRAGTTRAGSTRTRVSISNVAIALPLPGNP